MRPHALTPAPRPGARRRRGPSAARTVAAAGLLVLLAGCSGGGAAGTDGGEAGSGDGGDGSTEQGVDTSAPEVGACRVLAPVDVEEPTNDTDPVPCSEPHTAETYAVGPLPKRFDDAAFDDPGLSDFAYRRCSNKFPRFLGAEETRVIRSVLDWGWFRPDQEAWEAGARWYRCDVVGDQLSEDEYATLPRTAKGALSGLKPPDRLALCGNGETVAGSEKVPCSEPHTWRAVTSIKLGGPDDPYPGDRVAEVNSRDYCSDSVGAYLNYPLDYEFGYTWFGEGEWEAGNRLSICWTRTDG